MRLEHYSTRDDQTMAVFLSGHELEDYAYLRLVSPDASSGRRPRIEYGYFDYKEAIGEWQELVERGELEFDEAPPQVIPEGHCRHHFLTDEQMASTEDYTVLVEGSAADSNLDELWGDIVIAALEAPYVCIASRTWRRLSARAS